jgi:hypothetical protein
MDALTPADAVNDPIDHHYLPIFYQEAWADADGRVTRYSRPRDRVVAKSCAPKRTGSQEQLYTHHGVGPERRAYLETEFFASVDSKGAIAHRLLVGHGVPVLTPDQRIDWARYMMSTQLRHPLALDEVWRLADQSMRGELDRPDAEYDAIRKPDDPPTLYGWTEESRPRIIENIHKTWLPGLIGHPELGRHLINMEWSVIDTSTAARRLLTGDRPMIFTRGWKDPNTALFFPLSPTKLFVATNGRPQTERLLNRSAAFLARFANEQVTRFAVDFVIGADAAQVDFVERNLRRLDREPVTSPIGRFTLTVAKEPKT